MWMIPLLLSIAGEDAPAAAAAVAEARPTEARCQNARVQSAQAGPDAGSTLRSLGEEPLANAYRPVVRYAHCDRPVVVATRVGEKQR